MAFAPVACDPEAGEKSFRKPEAPARGGDAMVAAGEMDANFTDAIRIPLPPVDFTEEGHTDLPFTSAELARHVGACTVNPLANLPFDPEALPPPPERRRVLVVGGGAAGMQAAITACDRGRRGDPGADRRRRALRPGKADGAIRGGCLAGVRAGGLTPEL